MSKTHQSLSDLLDGRCLSADLDGLLKDGTASESWHRYSAVSSILKNEYSASADFDFCKEISQKIADEPAIIATSRSKVVMSKSVSKPMNADVRRIGGGFAIAASMAFATFFSFQTLQVTSDLSAENNNTAQNTQSSLNNASVGTIAPSEKINSVEQMELELFNNHFMQQARQSEQDSIAPFATHVGGEYVKTMRISAEQWQQILQRAAEKKLELEGAKKSGNTIIEHKADTNE